MSKDELFFVGLFVLVMNFLLLLAFFGGMLFLSVYLLIESYRTRGNVAALLLGQEPA